MSGIGGSRPTSWLAASMPPAAAPTRISTLAAARRSRRESLRHAGVLVPLSPAPGGDTRARRPMLRDAPGRPAPPLAALEEGRRLLVRSRGPTDSCTGEGA